MEFGHVSVSFFGLINFCLQLAIVDHLNNVGPVHDLIGNPAAIHWAQRLNVANGVGAKPLGDAGLHQFDDPRYRGLRIVCLHKLEVAVALQLSEIGDRSLVNLMGTGDDAALRSLPEHFGQPPFFSA
jgi:hypothetical protein